MSVSFVPFFEYAAPPCTGNSWFILSCCSTQLRMNYRPTMQDIRQSIFHFDGQADGCLRVSTVRHPCDWLVHLYYARGNGALHFFGPSMPRLREFKALKGTDLDTFVDEYLENMPGAISEVFDSYKCESRLRAEDMPWALVELLDSCGVTAGRRITESKPWQTKEKLDSRRRHAILEAESDLCTELDYY